MPQTAEAMQELRDHLAGAGVRREQHNRPTVLLIAGGLVFAVTLVVLLVSVTQRLAADRDLSRERAQAQDLGAKAARLEQLNEAASQKGRSGIGAPIETIRSRISTVARESGVKGDVPLPTPKTGAKSASAGARQQRLQYEVRDESLDNLIAWMQNAAKDIPGLEVYSVTLRPEVNAWYCKVIFSRWEWESDK